MGNDIRDKMRPAMRAIVRYVALGMHDEDICVTFPEYTPRQISQMRTGATFKAALKDMQAEIDEEMIGRAAEDPVRAYLHGKGLSMAHRLVGLADNDDGETPHAVQAKAADSILNRAGYGRAEDTVTLPVLMLSQEKLDSVLAKPNVLADVPDYVDGHTEELVLARPE